MRRTEEMEKNHEPNLDVVAGLTGEMLGEIFCWREDEWAEEMRSMGFYIGKFIYIMDAYEDYLIQHQRSSFGVAPVFRELNLSRGQRDHFFQLLMGKDIEIEDLHGIRRKVKIYQGNPPVSVFVQKAGKQGLKVSLDKRFYSFIGEKYLYILDQDTLYQCDREFSMDLRVFFEQMTQGYNAPYEVTVGEKEAPLFYERVLKKFESYGILEVKDVELEDLKPVQLKAKFMFESPGPGG